VLENLGQIGTKEVLPQPIRLTGSESHRPSRQSAVSAEFFPSYGQKTGRARCPTHEPHFKHRFMINQAQWALCLGQTANILIYM